MLHFEIQEAKPGKVWRRLGAAMALLLGCVALGANAQSSPVAETAATPAPIPVERFFQRPAVLEAKLSPSGKQLALTTSKGGNRVRLVVVGLGDGYKATGTAGFIDADIVDFECSDLID